MKNELHVGQKVYFVGDLLPMVVRATSLRYAVVSRKMSKREDDDLLAFEVERKAYTSKAQAYEDIKDCPVYSILDFQDEIRGADNLIFGIYDYFDNDECCEVIRLLESNDPDDDLEISYRNRGHLDIDWELTKKAKRKTSG